MSFGTAQPYIASYLTVKKNGKIAFLLRSNTNWMNGFYSLPSGKVEKDESYLTAVVREAKEELGIEVDENDLKHVLTMHRNEPSDHAKDWVDIFFEASKWQGEPHNAEPEMHSELAWLDPNDLPENVIKSVAFAVKQIAAGKTYCEYGW